MLCPNCESENRDGAKFCDECGFPLTGAIARAAAMPSSITGDIDPVQDQAIGEDSADEIQADPEPVEGAKPFDEPAAPERNEDDLSGTSADFAEAEAGLSEDELADEAPAGDGALGDDVAAGDALGEAAAAETADDEAAFDDASGEEPAEPETLPESVGSEEGAADLTMALDVDLAGFDKTSDEYGERLVDASYKPPEANWRDGGTMQMPRLNSEDTPRSKDYLASSTTKQKNTGKKVAIAVVVIAVLAAAVAFGTYYMQLWGGKVVPDVTGMTESDARSVLVDNGFTVRSEQVKSDDTEGLVLIMDPAAGSRANEGSEVVVHIATARTIPDIIGKSQDDAAKALEVEGFASIVYKTKNSSEEEGTVLEVEPGVGTRAKSSTGVVVTVAQPFTVPDISNLSFDDAVTALTDAGFGYDVVYINTDLYPEGSIIGTEPQAGAEVAEGTYVYIQIAQARGSQLVQAASSLLAPGATITINGNNYVIESLNSVSYLGGDVVAYAITAKPFTYLFGEMLVASTPQTVSGQVTFNESNEVIAIS